MFSVLLSLLFCTLKAIIELRRCTDTSPDLSFSPFSFSPSPVTSSGEQDAEPRGVGAESARVAASIGGMLASEQHGSSLCLHRVADIVDRGLTRSG